MRLFKYYTLLLIILVQLITGCGGGGGGGGGESKITSSISTSFPTSTTAVSTVSIAGVSSPIVCGVNLQVTFPSGTLYANTNPSNGIPAGTIISLVNSSTTVADITVFGTVGFGSGEIATINYTVPLGSSLANFGVSILKVFDCNGLQIQ